MTDSRFQASCIREGSGTSAHAKPSASHTCPWQHTTHFLSVHYRLLHTRIFGTVTMPNSGQALYNLCSPVICIPRAQCIYSLQDVEGCIGQLGPHGVLETLQGSQASLLQTPYHGTRRGWPRRRLALSFATKADPGSSTRHSSGPAFLPYDS